MFTGEYPCKIDRKNRVNVPFRFLKSLGGIGADVIIVEGYEACLCLYPFDLETIKQKFGNIPSCLMTQIRAGKRITVSEGLKKHAKLKKEVIMAGCNNYIEVWDKELWEREKASANKVKVKLKEESAMPSSFFVFIRIYSKLKTQLLYSFLPSRFFCLF